MAGLAREEEGSALSIAAGALHPRFPAREITGGDHMADRMPTRGSRVVFAVPKRANWTGSAAERLEGLGGQLLRYGLVGILLYLGAFKFTAVEAHAIQPLVVSSPPMAWLYSWLSVRGVSNLIGAAELLIAGLIALRPVAPAMSAWGSLGAVGMFLTTLSFLVTTPGMWERVPGFPLPVPTAGGGFLLKDVFLLGAAAWSAGEGRRAAREGVVMRRRAARRFGSVLLRLAVAGAAASGGWWGEATRHEVAPASRGGLPSSSSRRTSRCAAPRE